MIHVHNLAHVGIKPSEMEGRAIPLSGLQQCSKWSPSNGQGHSLESKLYERKTSKTLSKALFEVDPGVGSRGGVSTSSPGLLHTRQSSRERSSVLTHFIQSMVLIDVGRWIWSNMQFKPFVLRSCFDNWNVMGYRYDSLTKFFFYVNMCPVLGRVKIKCCCMLIVWAPNLLRKC